VATGSPLGAKFIAALLDRREDRKVMLKYGGNLDHLFGDHELPSWLWLKQHLARHGDLPARDTFSRHCDLRLPVEAATQEPPSYYLDHLQNRHIERVIRAASREAGEFLGREASERDPRRALEILIEQLGDLSVRDRAAQLHDFRDAFSPVLAAHSQALQGAGVGIETGWPTLDGMIGGIQPGDLFSIVGRPQEGKSWAMVWMALHAWRQGHPVMMMTVEMSALSILQRLAALYTGVPSSALRLGQMTSDMRERFGGRMILAQDSDVPLYVVDATQAPTVPDIAMLTQQLKPEAVYIDGAYLLRHSDPGMTKFRKVAAVCDQIKFDLATELQIATVASWQFSRDAVKRKRGDDRPVGLEDIAFADEIGQNSSVITGLLGDKTPESIRSKLMSILKDRDGPSGGEFRINWEFEITMDFSELDKNEEEHGTIEHVG
jgi:replicative DNA helicase